MTREECEKLIAEKLHEIIDIYLQYNPDGRYLSMTFQKDENGRFYTIRNECWDQIMNDDGSVRVTRGNDFDTPIDYFESVKPEEGDSVESE